jgi:hypothetical protein
MLRHPGKDSADALRRRRSRPIGDYRQLEHCVASLLRFLLFVW